MIVADGPETYGYTIFCEDIRFEIGGKLTYVGVYSRSLLVQSFPFTQPKFAMDIVYLQRRRSFVPPTKFIVVLPGESEENASISFAFQESDISKALDYAERNAVEGSEIVRMGGPLSFSNLLFHQPGALKVRALRGDEFIRLGALKIEQHPEFVGHEEKRGRF